MATQHTDPLLFQDGGHDDYQKGSEFAHVAPSNLEWGFSSTRMPAAMYGKKISTGWGGPVKYVSEDSVETKDNSSTITRISGGRRFQTQATPTDNDDVVWKSLDAAALAHGKMWSLNVVVQLSSAANLGVSLGFATDGLGELFTADPTDGLVLLKAKNSASGGLMRLKENGNAAVDTTVAADKFTMVDATEHRFSIRMRAGKPGQTGTVAATDCLIRATFDGRVIPATSAQLTALAAMLNTSAPTLAAYVGFRVNSTTQRNGLVAYCWFEVDR
jgi:hypothetical protein